ncbi:MAG: type II toxin-antitoxin system HicA family toxin [Oligoflexales bacterium]|nr:type II toxin-antitoxin system HicA family toxin [Oligoflexales bacterium]
MGFKKYPPLKPRQVINVLQKNGFIFKRQIGSHQQYEAFVEGKRRVVTVPDYSELDKSLLKSIFSQSGLDCKVFYK